MGLGITNKSLQQIKADFVYTCKIIRSICYIEQKFNITRKQKLNDIFNNKIRNEATYKLRGCVICADIIPIKLRSNWAN